MEKLLSTQEAANILGIKAQTLEKQRSVFKGDFTKCIPYVLIGRYPRYRASELEKWIERHTVGHVA